VDVRGQNREYGDAFGMCMRISERGKWVLLEESQREREREWAIILLM